MVPWGALERLGGVWGDPHAERRRWGALFTALTLISIGSALLLGAAYALLGAPKDAGVAVCVALGSVSTLIFFRVSRDVERSKRFVLGLFVAIFVISAVTLAEVSYLAWVAVMIMMAYLVGGLAMGLRAAVLMGVALVGAGFVLIFDPIEPAPVSDAVRFLRVVSLAPVLGAYGYLYELARVRNAAELEAARVAALHSNEAKGRLLSKVSHEIRTPLNGVLGLTRALLSRESLPPAVIEDLQLIEQSGEGLLALINDLLDIGRAEAGRIELHPRPVELCKLLQDLASLHRDAASAKRLALSVEGAVTEPLWVLVDESRLRQILGNLLSNALKFTDLGSVVLRLRARSEPGEKVSASISIEDTGTGLDASSLAQVFEPFKQFHTQRALGGSGLGLAISQELARAMGGRVEALSAPGTGSTFTLELTLDRTAPPRRVEPAAQKLGAFCALIVDDNAINRRVACAFVSLLGGLPVEAEDGSAAVRLAQERQFDVILMDLHMPGLDGLETVAALREKGIDAPVLGVTGAAEPEALESCLRAGMVGCLVKPVQLARFRSELQRVLERELIIPSSAARPLPHDK